MKKGEEYTYSTDIWSLGVLVYELCLLEHPQTHYRLNKIKYLNGEIPKLNDKDYSQELSDLIQRMLNVEPEQRPTAGEILEICESLLKKGNSGYQGEMVNGVREGKGTYTFKDGDKYDGDWVRGKKEGQGTYYFSNGAKYEGNWVQSKMEGKGIFYYKNGDKYDGEWKDNKREGNGIYYYSNGSKYEGEWKNDKKEGNGSFTYTKKGIWKDNEYQNN